MFSVSMKTQYGLRALVRLAKNEEDGMSIADIAKLEGISPKYLEGIAAVLRSAGLLTSHRGKNGGYRLSRRPKDISMLDVITALEGDITPVACCESGSGCAKSSVCQPSRFWNGLKGRIDDYLRESTLADLQG
jgi:Rrf2 family protein